MNVLLEYRKKIPEYEKMCSMVSSGERVLLLYGVSNIHRAYFASALEADFNRPVLLVCRDERTAREMAKDISAFSGETCEVLCNRELIFYPVDNVSREHEHQRLNALYRYMSGESRVLATSAEALMLRTMPPDILRDSLLSIRMDGEYALPWLLEKLTALGYARTTAVEGPGQFSIRGGILDVFPPSSEHPVRAEFFGDSIDSMGYFDVESQRRTENVQEVLLLPVRETVPQLMPGGAQGLADLLRSKAQNKHISAALSETLLGDADRLSDLGDLAAADRYMELIYPFATALSYLPDNTLVLLCDSEAVVENAKGCEYRLSEDVTHLLEGGLVCPQKQGLFISGAQMREQLMKRQVVLMDSFLGSTSITPGAILSVSAKQLPSYSGNLDTAASDLGGYLSMGYTTFALAGGELRAQNLQSILTRRDIPCTGAPEKAGRGKVCVLADSLSAGFEFPTAALAAVSDSSAGHPKRRTREKAKGRNRINRYTDLTPGDLVVHEHHGIGRFIGMERISVDGVWRDYVKIAYAGTDYVFVPVTNLDLVSKYIGGGEQENVKLNKLGSPAWNKSKSRAKKAAKEMAEALIKLYAARRSQSGFAFQPDEEMQRSFEEAFPFEETEDQLICAREIKADMERPWPMDRLLCGDVGFGKTEVAFRAVMKCILSGKQAAILVPTTVLARQHYLTASERFSGYPVRVEVMSRFQTPAKHKQSLLRLSRGDCDLVVGTHRLLQKDVHFKNLGLLVVDEEQRFGVSHKEQIKQMTNSVDVLTLTATPIPRTLNMALGGIRDMSVLEEAPMGRQPVQTYVLEHSDAILRDAIRRELDRGGQVYYLHNRIETINRVADELQRRFPETTVRVVHGRMSEEEIGDVMSRTYEGEIGILVCTTIIETGIDIPNVNTLIIEDSDKLGLAQLHQIRGRVGRSYRHAYAYFTYRKGKVLTEIQQKRLSAIREFAEFGSGFKIAMRDLEIRGAGNVLGAEQSGHMAGVGYDMYLKLLEEAASELTGQKPKPRTECTAELLVSATLPQSYISDPGTRMDLYRRIALISSQEDFLDMQEEMLDRFGDIPLSAQALLDIALLRANASSGGIREITQKNGSLLFYFIPQALEKAAAVCGEGKWRGRMLLNAGDDPYFSVRLKPVDDPLEVAIQVVDRYKSLA